MVHRTESKNRAAACVPEHKGVEESELTRPRAGEAQRAPRPGGDHSIAQGEEAFGPPIAGSGGKGRSE